jgi:hypothetical protein
MQLKFYSNQLNLLFLKVLLIKKSLYTADLVAKTADDQSWDKT